MKSRFEVQMKVNDIWHTLYFADNLMTYCVHGTKILIEIY